MRRLCLAAVIVTTLLSAATGAQGKEPPSSGWWWLPQQLPSLIPISLPAPPYVPAGDLLVESLFGQPDAIAAVQSLVPAGRSAKTLILDVHPVFGTAQLSVCTPRSVWSPVVAGRWDARPVCDGASIPMHAKAGSYTVDVSRLATDGGLDVVVIPTPQDGGTGTAIFSAVIAAPTFKSIVTVPAQATTPAPTPATSRPPSSASEPAVPPMQAVPPLPAVSQPTAPTPVVASPAPAAAAASSRPEEHRAVVIALLAVVALGAAIASRVPSRPPRALVSVVSDPPKEKT